MPYNIIIYHLSQRLGLRVVVIGVMKATGLLLAALVLVAILALIGKSVSVSVSVAVLDSADRLMPTCR